MKRNLFFVFLGTLLATHCLQADNLDEHSVYKQEHSTMEEVIVDFDAESFVKIVRVGSPIWNFMRDVRRSVADLDGGPGLTQSDQFLFDAKNFSNIQPNTLIVFKEFLAPRKATVLKPQGITYYLWDQAKGLIELPAEAYQNSLLFALGRAVVQPGAEIVAAVLTDEPFDVRLQNAGEDFVDGVTGAAYTFADIFERLFTGDFTRSIKAVVRLPFSIADIGLAQANNIIALPFQIGNSAVRAMTEDEVSSQEELYKTISENHKFDINLTLGGDRYIGTAFFYYYRFNGLMRGRADYHLHNITKKTYERIRNEAWEADYIRGRPLWAGALHIDGKRYQLKGVVDGSFDIDIKGVLTDEEYAPNPFYDSAPAPELGTFHFDD